MPKQKKPIIDSASSLYQQQRLGIIFEYSPVAIWEEDFSAFAKLRKTVEKAKVDDIRAFLLSHPQLVNNTFRSLKILDVNRAALRLYGAKSKDELISNLGKTIHKHVFNVLVDEFTALLEGKDTFETEFRSRTIDGKTYDVRMKLSLPEVYKDSYKRVIVTLEDISVQRKYERHLKRLAQTDGLTMVLNQNALRYRLEDEFARAKRYHLDLSCMMIDLDDFKKVNDKYGHQVGDQVLKRTAKIIRRNLREVDVVGRYGGDEFMVILPETSAENAKIAASRLRDIFDLQVKKSTKRAPYVTVSIGVGGRPSKNISNPKEMIEQIDKAMY
ncbi:MAG: sensor domain-containing diguanylate cyclase, partial [Candidatus Omnitrophica bacterium]|nr:sensor domain-containing diguanylate cyclase [Candidatus Omnitrophota bacterium]